METNKTTRRVWAKFSKLAIGTKFSCVNERGEWPGYIKVEAYMVDGFGLVNAKRWATEGSALPTWDSITMNDNDRVIAILPRK